MIEIPAAFAQHMVELYGAAGRAWVDRLPALLMECARQWSLQIGPPFPLSFNYVAPATQPDGTEVVLKVGYPSGELWTELEALRLYDGRGMVRLLDSDRARGALLLERLRPGTPLAALADDAAATAIAAAVMQQFWRPVPPDHPFPTVGRWAAGLGRLRARYGGGTGPLPAALVARAEALFAELLASQAPPVLLHGDLHHDNILRATRAPWLALDPKGVVGEPAYETGALLRNPLPQLLQQPDPARVTARRVDQLADLLGLDRARIRGWGFAQAVLSAWWCLEDEGYGWGPAIACAAILAALPA